MIVPFIVLDLCLFDFWGGGVGSNSPEVGATSPLLGFLLPLDLLLLLSAVLLLCQDEHCSEFSVGIKC